jgi:hypothetical protein
LARMWPTLVKGEAFGVGDFIAHLVAVRCSVVDLRSSQPAQQGQLRDYVCVRQAYAVAVQGVVEP